MIFSIYTLFCVAILEQVIPLDYNMFKTALFIVGGLVSAATIIYALSLALGSTNDQATPSSNPPLAVDSLKFLVVVSIH